VEFRLLGNLEVLIDGAAVDVGGTQPRTVLAMLLVAGGRVVPAESIIEALWGQEPPDSAAGTLQSYVSRLRRALVPGGPRAEAARVLAWDPPGYKLAVGAQALDTRRFEALADQGRGLLLAGDPESARTLLDQALALWRGPALLEFSHLDFAWGFAAKLEERRLAATEDRVEADLRLGRHAQVVGELGELVAAHPLREQLRHHLALALYRSGRQAEALQAYSDARSILVGELGIEPSASLTELQLAILRQDASLVPVAEPLRVARRSILVAALAPQRVGLLAALGAPLAREPARELLLLTTVSAPGELTWAGTLVNDVRAGLVEDGVEARAAVFTSVAPGIDMARLARENDVDLVLVDAPDGLLEDARILGLLDHAPCDVGVVVGGMPGPGHVVVPFAGADHDWAAVELGAWLARTRGSGLRLVGATTGAEGRDASRLLANASIAVQRALGVPAEPMLVEPDPNALVAVGVDAGVVVVGLTDRWRREGLGRARTALATQTASPTILVRRGMRPGGLAPRESETRFTWTVAG
jgi:DNA-binding SARP family transcriptional activator